MNALGILFTIVACVLQLALPRRYAILPLLASVVLTTRGQVLDLGGLNFTIMRLVIGVGFLRTQLRGETPAHGVQRVDGWLLAWTVWLLASAPFHASGAFVFRLGMAWDYLGAYFLGRVFLRSPEDIVMSFKALCVMLVPVAVSMVLEKTSDRNAFSILGGVAEYSAVRAGNIRATGPFAHPILAGTVGAALLAMAYAVRSSRVLAAIGLVTGGAIVIASTSSGPVLMVAFIVVALLLQPLHRHLNAVRWLALLGILALAAVMKDPVYFLMAKIDIAGGSTGWFRAQLIRSSLEHLDEWWLVGTDYTRHWMPTGNPANEGMTDITNHYLKMGVWGGLPLVFLFLMMQLSAFGQIGRAMRDTVQLSAADRSLGWIVGALMFGHAMNFFSISLFDNTNTLFLLLFPAAVAIRRERQAAPQRTQTRAAPVRRSPAPRYTRRSPTWR